jgi:hypothetical protein
MFSRLFHSGMRAFTILVQNIQAYRKGEGNTERDKTRGKERRGKENSFTITTTGSRLLLPLT